MSDLSPTELLEWPVEIGSINQSAWDGFDAKLVTARHHRPTAYARRRHVHSIFFNLGWRPIDMESRIEGGPARHTPLAPRACTITPAGATLRGVVNQTRSFEYLVVGIASTALREVAGHEVDVVPRLGCQYVALMQSALKLRIALQTDGEIGRLYAAQVGTVMSTELVLGSPRGVPRGGLPPAALRRVLDRLQDDPAVDPDPQELIGLSGVSRGHFFRAFKESMGLSPERYLTTIRIERARALIAADPSVKIEAVATLVGLRSAQRLRAAFLRVTGSSLASMLNELR